MRYKRLLLSYVAWLKYQCKFFYSFSYSTDSLTLQMKWWADWWYPAWVSCWSWSRPFSQSSPLYRSLFYSLSLRSPLINYKGTTTKRRLYLCLREFIERRYCQSCWYFWPSFVNYCPSNLLSGSPPPPLPPFIKSKYSIYRQCVAVRGWGGVELCWRPYSAGV
jgi:hypothetical protein